LERVGVEGGAMTGGKGDDGGKHQKQCANHGC
jgi:hypothetical protein